MEWKEVLLGELVDIYDSKRIPLTSQEREKIKGDIPYYGAQGIIDYINQFLFDGEYILIAEDGNNIISRQENIAQIAKGKFWVNNHAHILQGKIEQNLLCYIINHTDISGYVTGSAQPKLNQANLLKIPIKIPVNLSDQRKIAGILSALDSKIENNNKINANLEAQAQALFKSWFVDFTPFKDQPFVDSELGPIPQGLKICQISDISHTLETGRRQKGGAVSEGIPSVGAEHVKGIGTYDYSKTKYISPEFANKLKTGKINGYELLIYKDGGKPGYFIPNFSIFGEGYPFDLCYLNEHVFKLDFLQNKGYNIFNYFQFKTNYVMSFLNAQGGKAAIPGINKKDIECIYTFAPNNPKVVEFGNFALPLFTKILRNCVENQRLAALRDTLLPKLMSGEIKL